MDQIITLIYSDLIINYSNEYFMTLRMPTGEMGLLHSMFIMMLGRVG